MMIQMMEADLEVIDTVAEFRAEAANPVLVSWVNDFHTGSTGRRIAARALAERLRRYAFARDLAPNRDLWNTEEKTRTGASFPQRITTVNRMLTEVNKGDEKPGQRTWPRKHPGKWAVLRDDAPEGIVEALAQRSFRYLEVVPDDAPQPRVVVLTFLPKYFWHRYKGKGKKIRPSKYKPRPMPEYAGGNRAGGAGGVGGDPFAVTVQTTGVSAKPTDDPTELDHDEALMHVAAVVEDGPLEVRETGLRYWILHDGAWTAADGEVAEGERLELAVRAWRGAIADDEELARHQIFNSTEQDFSVPVFWITGGALAPDRVISD